jgi:single-strand DNA-binding protein
MDTSMKNKVQLVGLLGHEPELKAFGQGRHVLRLNIATNERYKGNDGQWHTDTQWHTVVAWDRLAEKLAVQVEKGSGLVVEGRLVHRRYETRTGEKRVATEVVLGDYQLLAKPVTAEKQQQ